MILADHLRSLEQQLLDPAVRASATALTDLLAPEFLEFGSSGRTFTREEVIAELATEPSSAQLSLTGFTLHASTSDWALVTYRSTRETPAGSRTSLRSSTWVLRHGRWQLLFHQGTPEPSAAVS